MRVRPLAFGLAVALALVAACGRFGREQDADDGGTDASSDGGSARSCPAKLCVDFDDPSVAPPWGFDEAHAPAPESFTIVPGLSPPNALSIKGTVSGPTYLQHGVPSTATMVRMSVAMRFDEVVAATSAWLLQIRCSAGGGYNYVIKLQNGQIVLKNETLGTVSPITNVTPGTWTPMELGATLSPTSSAVTAKVREQPATMQGGPCAPESLRVGSAQLDSGYVRISVDDIVLDWN